MVASVTAVAASRHRRCRGRASKLVDVFSGDQQAVLIEERRGVLLDCCKRIPGWDSACLFPWRIFLFVCVVIRGN
jgi:hypothetical protein